ncbi:CHAT domain-containing protein [Okeania sp. KiyG1]|uniref:CHAT domain-containing protein n=1 Tax=Okeania sp. KiyG1 TaxID=2720165 RepID=UPI001923548D|nr:CHAT domain-containing tetratricopeptide repeat protein [Okeania sp. KiyG1]GGA57736.1 hypothetical protein CYANOKiyG1_78850 [Okeania sp. KiyG1]
MKLYQLTTTAIITLVSILGNPLESFSQKKFFIPSALAQYSWVGNPYRIEITEKTSYGEINMFLVTIEGKRQYKIPISEADKRAIIESLEKIEALKINIRGINSRICLGYNIAEDWEKAVKACERSLRAGELPNIMHPIHEAYFGAKKYNKAINSLKKSLRSDDHQNIHVSYLQLGSIYFKLGNYTEAIRQYQKAIDSIEAIDQHEHLEGNLSLINSRLGFSLLRQGKIGAAEKKFFEAMRNDQKSWNNTIVNFSNIWRFGNTGGLWEGSLEGGVGIFTNGLTELRIEQGKDTEALEFAEYGRTRTLSYLINKNQESSITIDEIKAIAKEQNATLVKYFMPRSINYFEMKQTYEPQLYIWVVKPTGEVYFVNKKLSSANSKYNHILSNSYSLTPDKNSNSFPNLATFILLLIIIAGIPLFLIFPRQQNLILISSFFTALITTATIINNQKTTTSNNQNSEVSLANLSRNTFANVRGSTRNDLPESATGSNCQNKEEKKQVIIIDDCLKETHKVLIEPIAQLLPKNPEEEVIIIPDAELFRVPFSALKGSDNKYLIQKHTLRVSPSIKLLQLTQQQKAQKAPNLSNRNLVVGNPVMAINYDGTQRGPLPYAEIEAVAIAQLLNTTPITGAGATKSRITRLMPNSNIIHLATHGTPSSLDFAPSGQDRGFLTEWDIYQLNLTADLVVLSACETGLGEITTDGVVGIARPFVGAGVPSVVISLWQVPDSTTSELMIDFYKNLQAGQNKAQALRQAMLTTMEKYPEPGYWAGFFLVGES